MDFLVEAQLIGEEETGGWTIDDTVGFAKLAEGRIDIFQLRAAGGMLANYGILGLSYELDEDGVPYFIEEVTDNPNGFTLWQTTYVYTQRLGVKDMRREASLYSEAYTQSQQVWGTNKDNAYALPTMATMTAEEAAVFNPTFSDLQTYCSEAILAFIRGEKLLNEFSGFVDSLYSMGLQECIDCWQNAYNRYIAR